MRTIATAALAGVASLGPPDVALAGTDSGAARVTGWVDVTLREISGHRVNPPLSARGLALVSVAMQRGSASGPDGVHGAAAEVLGYLFPDRASIFDQRALALGHSGAQLRRGRAIGAHVIERAQRDNSDTAYSGIRLFGTGDWTEPPGVAGPFEPAACQWLPWNIASGSAHRPPPPPAPEDPDYAEAVREVYETSRKLTPGQRRIALFWADGAGTETPPGHWNRIAMELVEGAQLSYRNTARTFALLNTAQADAFIAAWDAKFVYWSERPDQAIRRMVDPDWSPLIATPPFPGYVSGHSTTSGAASTVLSAIFPRHSGDLASIAAEAAISRLYGGIHFRMDNDAGLVLGRRVGSAALARNG